MSFVFVYVLHVLLVLLLMCVLHAVKILSFPKCG